MSDYDFPPDVGTEPFFEENTAIYAGPGGGKSFLCKKLIMQHKPPIVVWIDTLQPQSMRPKELQQRIDSGQKLITASAFEDYDLAKLFIEICYAKSTKSRRIFMVCDEAGDYLNVKDERLKRVFRTGRHYGLGSIIATQRPAMIDQDFRGTAPVRYWGKLCTHPDVALAKKELGPMADNINNFAPGEFIHFPTLKRIEPDKR